MSIDDTTMMEVQDAMDQIDLIPARSVGNKRCLSQVDFDDQDDAGGDNVKKMYDELQYKSSTVHHKCRITTLEDLGMDLICRHIVGDSSVRFILFQVNKRLSAFIWYYFYQCRSTDSQSRISDTVVFDGNFKTAHPPLPYILNKPSFSTMIATTAHALPLKLPQCVSHLQVAVKKTGILRLFKMLAMNPYHPLTRLHITVSQPEMVNRLGVVNALYSLQQFSLMHDTKSNTSSYTKFRLTCSDLASILPEQLHTFETSFDLDLETLGPAALHFKSLSLNTLIVANISASDYIVACSLTCLPSKLKRLHINGSLDRTNIDVDCKLKYLYMGQHNHRLFRTQSLEEQFIHINTTCMVARLVSPYILTQQHRPSVLRKLTDVWCDDDAHVYDAPLSDGISSRYPLSSRWFVSYPEELTKFVRLVFIRIPLSALVECRENKEIKKTSLHIQSLKPLPNLRSLYLECRCAANVEIDHLPEMPISLRELTLKNPSNSELEYLPYFESLKEMTWLLRLNINECDIYNLLPSLPPNLICLNIGLLMVGSAFVNVYQTMQKQSEHAQLFVGAMTDIFSQLLHHDLIATLDKSLLPPLFITHANHTDTSLVAETLDKVYRQNVAHHSTDPKYHQARYLDAHILKQSKYKTFSMPRRENLEETWWKMDVSPFVAPCRTCHRHVYNGDEFLPSADRYIMEQDEAPCIKGDYEVMMDVHEETDEIQEEQTLSFKCFHPLCHDRMDMIDVDTSNPLGLFRF